MLAILRQTTLFVSMSLLLLVTALVPSSLPVNAQSIVDFSNPESVVKAIFRAARNERFAVLAELCDPEGENDEETQRICDVPATSDDQEEFVNAFETGKINGEVQIDAQAGFATIPILISDADEPLPLIFTLIARNQDLQEGGEWYLYCLGEEACVDLSQSDPNQADPIQKGRSVDWQPTSTQLIGRGRPNEIYGVPALNVGDVNGDGFDDLMIGSLGNPDSERPGRAQLYLGSAQGVQSRIAWKMDDSDWAAELDSDLPLAVINIGRLGNVNGDGLVDVALTVFRRVINSFPQFLSIMATKLV